KFQLGSAAGFAGVYIPQIRLDVYLIPFLYINPGKVVIGAYIITMLNLYALVPPWNGQDGYNLPFKDGPGLGSLICGNDHPITFVLNSRIHGIVIDPKPLSLDPLFHRPDQLSLI